MYSEAHTVVCRWLKVTTPDKIRQTSFSLPPLVRQKLNCHHSHQMALNFGKGLLKPAPMGCRKYVSRGMVCSRAGMKGQSTVSPPPWWTLRKRLEIFKIPQFTLLAITPTTFQGIPWPSDNSQIDKYQDFVLCFASKRRCLLICKQNFYFCQRAFFSINWKTGNGKNSS